MNNDSILLTRRPRRARTVAVITATAGFALLAVACSSSPSSTRPSSSANAAGAVSSPASVSPALAFTRCVRAHGVPEYPDPDSNGAVRKESPQQLGVSDSQYQAAQSACQHLLPNGGQQTNTQTVADQRNAVRFAGCMRSHGVPNWPDPTIRPDGAPQFNAPAAGVDLSSPRVMATANRCQSLLHIDLESIGAG